LEQRWSKTQKRQLGEGLQAAREMQCKGRVIADSMSSRIVAAGERRSSLVVGFENMMRLWVMSEGPSRDWAWWRYDGCGAERPRRKEGKWGEGPSVAITAMFC